jgi:hypothetical protein
LKMTIAKPTRVWLFLGLALSINIIDPQLARTISKPPVGIAAAFDMAVVVPALYFWLVVKSGIQPLATMIPVCLLALLRATWVVPAPSMARPLLAALAEIAVIALVVSGTRRSLRSTRGGDVLERIESVILAFVHVPRLAAVAAGEMAVVYYAFAAWGRKPEVPPGMQGYSVHERSGTAFLFGALAGVSVVEVPLVHLLVMRWSVTAAWILSAIGVYGAIWLAGMSRALVLRPVLVGHGELMIRSGILWTLRVPLDRITCIRRAGGPSDLRLCPGADPNVAMEFSEPIIAAGMFGIRRRVTRVALAVDEPASFEISVDPDTGRNACAT